MASRTPMVPGICVGAKCREQPCPLQVRGASENERAVEIEHRPRANVLDAPSSFGTEPVEAQAVPLRIDQADKPGAQRRPLRRLQFALEYRILHTLSKIQTGARDPAQPFASGRRFRIDVVRDQHQHAYALPPRSTAPLSTRLAIGGADYFHTKAG